MRRIQRDVCHEELVKELSGGENAIFKEIWRVLLFGAAIGVREGKRRPLDKTDTGKAIPDTYFNTPGWRGFLYLIGVADTGDSACLRATEAEQELLVTAFEEYANYGLHLLADRIRGSASPLDELLSLLLEAARPATSHPMVDDLI